MNFTCLYRASSTVPPSCLFCLPLASILPLLPALSSRSRVYSAAAALSPRKLLRCRRAFALLLQDVPSPCRFRLQAGAVCSSPRTTPQPHSRPYIPRSESWSLRRRPWPAGRLQLRYRLPAPPSRTDVWAATRASRSAAEYTDALSKASGAHLSSRAGCKIAVVRRLLRPERSDLPSRLSVLPRRVLREQRLSERPQTFPAPYCMPSLSGESQTHQTHPMTTPCSEGYRVDAKRWRR